MYGSHCHRNLNSLTTLLWKLAVSSIGLVYLLKCRHYHVFPAFAMRSVKFTHFGHHLERIAEKLPRRILRVAIRDVRSRVALLQLKVDAIWNCLFSIVTRTDLWDALVLQKDSYYSSVYATSSTRLQKKFSVCVVT